MKNKFYIDKNKLNDYEKENKKISYAKLVDYLFHDMILCNNIVNVDEELFNNCESGNFDDLDEIYQYYIVNLSDCDLDFIHKYLKDEIILFYSEKLDNYILAVDHFGTCWSYVLTGLEYTTEYKNSMQDKLYE